MATDPAGLRPNQKGAITLERFLEEVRTVQARNPGMNPQQLLDTVVRHLKGRSDWLYIYTERAGWIDLQHFTEAASWQWLGDGAVEAAGVFVEYVQLLSITWAWAGGLGSSGSGTSSSDGSYASAFSEEDLRSNRYGIEFQNQWDTVVPLDQALEKFFTELGATEPENAPDYDELPWDEEDNIQRTHWYEPIVRYLRWSEQNARWRMEFRRYHTAYPPRSAGFGWEGPR